MNNHSFHMVDNSPWPLIASISTMTFLSGLILWFNTMNYKIMLLGMMMILMSSLQWWRDIIRESSFQGNHTKMVSLMMKWGMILFIVSEIFFFISFFWTFLHSSLSPNMEIGMKWPPMGIKTFNPMNIPMLNTMILLCSGISMTWSHQSILISKLNQSIKSMKITIMLGIYFSMLQMYEYYMSSFSIADSIYGSTFFISTGFHGIHVMIGTMFIMVSMIRTKKLHFSSKHHIGFESSAWYWHFVDIVWLFLYLMIYWWGS